MRNHGHRKNKVWLQGTQTRKSYLRESTKGKLADTLQFFYPLSTRTSISAKVFPLKFVLSLAGVPEIILAETRTWVRITHSNMCSIIYFIAAPTIELENNVYAFTSAMAYIDTLTLIIEANRFYTWLTVPYQMWSTKCTWFSSNAKFPPVTFLFFRQGNYISICWHRKDIDIN
jgi:hypothetical protein